MTDLVTETKMYRHTLTTIRPPGVSPIGLRPDAREGYVRASYDIHDDLQLVLDTNDHGAIDEAINTYLDWLLGLKTVEEAAYELRVLSQNTPHLYMDTVENSAWRVPLALGNDLTGIYVIYDSDRCRHWYTRESVMSTGEAQPIPSPITIARLLCWSFDSLALRNVQYVNVLRTDASHRIGAGVWERVEDGSILYPVFDRHPTDDLDDRSPRSISWK